MLLAGLKACSLRRAQLIHLYNLRAQLNSGLEVVLQCDALMAGCDPNKSLGLTIADRGREASKVQKFI